MQFPGPGHAPASVASSRLPAARSLRVRIRSRRSPRDAVLAAAAAAALAGVAGAQTAPLRFAELGKQHLPVDLEAAATAMAWGDVDGDGDLDLVVGKRGQQSRLHANDGNGVFTDVTAARLPLLTAAVYAVALGDVDGDGDLDLVVGTAGAAGAQNQLLLNDGTGTFADATAARLPAVLDNTFAIALGDVDGDGDLDLVAGNWGTNHLYLNDGTGSFLDATSALPPHNDLTAAIALGDVDADGDLDLVIGNYGSALTPGSRQNRLYLNTGAGVFFDATAGRLPTVADTTSALALGDVDGDGFLDLVVGNYARPGEQNRLYLNDGTGTFTDVTAVNLPAVLDVTTSLALGDVDGDGDADLVVGNSGQNRIHLNVGGGLFVDATAVLLPAAGDDTTAVAFGDVDGDGALDLVAGNWDRDRLYLNTGSGPFADATASPLPVLTDFTSAVALGDVDGDGAPDLVVGNGSASNGGQCRLHLNTGIGTFLDVTGSSLPAIVDGTTSLALGDVDGDGDLDLFTGNSSVGVTVGARNRLYLNAGTGTFADVTSARLPVVLDNTSALALGDVDGDGDLDLLVGNLGNGSGEQNRLYRNDGSGSFADVTGSALPARNDFTTAVAFGDVDGDGDLDVVVGESGNLALPVSMQDRLWRNDGSGTFTDVTGTSLPPGLYFTSSVALGDVDGDGDLDLVTGARGVLGAQNHLYLNDGTGVFTDVTATNLPPILDQTASVAFGDVDGDGDLDLLVGNTTPPDRLYLNDGSGTFAPVAAPWLPGVGDATAAIALGDVDGDGDLDAVIGNQRGPNRLLYNLHGQLHVPLTLRTGRAFALVAQVRDTPPNSTDLVFPFLSVRRVAIQLPPFGTLGITPDAPLGMAVMPHATGTATFALMMPNLPQFAGLRIHAQALILPAVGGRLTNVTSDVLIR